MPSAIKTQSVPAADRILTILELVGQSKRGLRLAEVAEQGNMPRSSAHCLLLTLERRGYLHRHEKSGRYMFGLKLFSLASYAINGLEVRELAAPHLAALMQQTGLTVHMAILEQHEPVLVSKIDAPGIFRLATWMGKRMDFHCTAVGKAIAAFLPEERLDELISVRGLPRHNENTIVSGRKLKLQLQQVRKSGHALDDEEEELGLRCIGVPIFNHESRVVAAISVSGTTVQIHTDNLSLLAERVKATASAISSTLGYSNPAEILPHSTDSTFAAHA
jgi:DNA-binding IclR family transcriptional regulator